MSREKQIEEMAKFVCNACEMGGGFDGECVLDNDYKTCHISVETAEALYNAGYRKQEWISVDERLPERIGKYLVFTVDRRIYICDFIDHYCDGDAQFDDYKVTHWMPLPKAPKVKGE